MKHITLLFTLSISFMLALFMHQGNQKIKAGLKSSTTLPPCSPACQFLDSTALEAIYLATGAGVGWTNNWILTDPVCSWPGVTLNANGNVTAIVLNNNGLTGNIPADIAILAPTLNVLQIDNNCLEGPITPEIGDCINLQTLFLDNNKLTGTIPESFGQLVNLLTLFLDNNQLTGTIPDTFLYMNSLQSLDVFNNCFDSIPDLSAMISLQPNKFRVQNNKLTFDDLLPNEFEIGTYYEPQDSFGTPITICLPTGLDTFIDLGIDAGVTTNSYEWFKAGSPYATTTTNKLFFSPVDWGDAGVYTTNVTNSIMTDLTLHGRPITVKVVCGQSVELIEDTFCKGSGDEVVVGGMTFDEDTPSGIVDVTDLDQYGCDSIVQINLTYYESVPVVIDTILCPGESIIVNGQVFDETMPSDIVNLGTIALFGCDSTIDVNVSYYPQTIGIVNDMICLDDSIEVYGKFYHEDNPTGQDTVSGVAFHGCDSIIQIDLDFFPQALAVFDDVLCNGNSVTIGGVLFDQGNPSDTLVLENMSVVNGCDSTIHVDLTFGPGVEITIDDLLCDGENVVINGTTYDQGTPDGTQFLPSGSPSECDTTIIIDLEFYVPDTGYYSPTVCEGGSVTFNGNVYDAATPNGTEIIASQLYPQCDSTVIVQLSFTPAASSTLDTTICPNAFIVVNGTTYDMSMPSGSEMINTGLCDSTVVVEVSFFPEAVNNIDTTLCPGGSIDIGGVIYDASFPNGTTTIGGGSFYGCDSTINIMITFFNEAILNIDTILCMGESIFVEGTEYDETNPSGSITTSDPSFHGCDSTINISVSYFPVSENFVTETLCFGESLTINSNTYDSSNPIDTIILTGESFYNCDSTIYIDLSFYPESTNNFTTTICLGDTININGTDYHEGNTDGVEIFDEGSQFNCDSTVTVHVDFFDEAESSIDTTLCFGEEILIGGVLFNASNTAQIIVLENANYNACDSTIVVSVDFHDEAYALFNSTLCFGQTLTVNDTIYSETNPTGMDTIFMGSFHGCDSIIEVNLTFNSSVQVTFDDMLCLDDSMIVNLVTYNAANPSGTETIIGGSYLGCDSVIVVDLQFPDGPAEFMLHGSYCQDVSFIVNGEVYDIDNPSGTEMMAGASSFGCDSTVYIDLEFFIEAVYNLDTTICPGASIIIENVVYDESNTMGIEVFEGANYNGCDSTLIINVSFFVPAVSDFDPTWCEGQSIVIGGILFDINNPMGTVILPEASFHACDSTVNVDISFSDAVEVTIDPKLCPGESVVVNGTIYDEDNPMGSDTIDMGSVSGCDSIIHVDLTFYDPFDLTFNLNQTLCPGDSVIVNGVVYNEDMPSGAEIIEDGSYSGCDSIVLISLLFHDIAVLNYIETLCPEDSVVFNNIVYNIDNPDGTDLLVGAAQYGCDSIIIVDLTFHNPAINMIDMTICEGDAVIINGMEYDTPGTYLDVITDGSSLGCDSILQITIANYPPVEDSITVTICEGDTYEINGNSYSTAGQYEEVFIDGSSMDCDSTVFLTLVVQTAEDLGLADAGMDMDICESSTTLTGNTFPGTNGIWTSLDGAGLSDPTQASTMATGMTSGVYAFVWTLSTATCLNYDADTVLVFVEASPEAVDDTFFVESGITYVELKLLDNDNLNGVIDWTIDIPNPPAGNLTDLGDGIYGFEADSSLLGTTVSFEYDLCNINCTDCSTATVTITFDVLPITPPDPPKEFPNAITPNGDGTNDVFIIPLLEEDPEQYFTRELIVFNRWGDVVYQSRPYQNDWNGKSNAGKDLSEGTYYYVFRLDLGQGVIYKGDITILR